MAEWDLAQLNVSRLRHPAEDARNREFFAALDAVNALADAHPGFRWRLQSDEGNATAIRPFDDESLLINMSTWESIEALSHYAYRTEHKDFLRRRREWFDRPDEMVVALWWVPAGHHPDVAEAVERLEHLREHGPTPTAFTFLHRFLPEPTPSVDNGNATPAS